MVIKSLNLKITFTHIVTSLIDLRGFYLSCHNIICCIYFVTPYYTSSWNWQQCILQRVTISSTDFLFLFHFWIFQGYMTFSLFFSFFLFYYSIISKEYIYINYIRKIYESIRHFISMIHFSLLIFALRSVELLLN